MIHVNNRSNVFRLSLFIYLLIMLYSAYKVKVNDSKWFGYTFMGVSLWIVGIILATPTGKTSSWYRADKLLSYPLLSLVIFIVACHSSDLFDFLLKTIILSGVGELLVYILQKRLNRKNILAYYLVLVILAWALSYGYFLIPLTYTLFVLYCATTLLQVINEERIAQLT